MKKTLNVRNLCLSGVIAALYAGLTLLLAPISYGPVQFRVSEALTLLPVLTPAAGPGLVIGCFLANLLGSTVEDAIIGTGATFVAALLTRECRGNKWIAAFWLVICNALIVGIMLYAMFGGSWIVNILTVGLGEAVVCYALGIPLVKVLEKSPRLFDNV